MPLDALFSRNSLLACVCAELMLMFLSIPVAALLPEGVLVTGYFVLGVLGVVVGVGVFGEHVLYKKTVCWPKNPDPAGILLISIGLWAVYFVLSRAALGAKATGMVVLPGSVTAIATIGLLALIMHVTRTRTRLQ